MNARIWTVDAFTDVPFKGNPAGVCLLEKPADDSWMQSVAAEMNHAETAFLVPGAGGFGLRWFTPVAEVELCGHATLASSHVLWSEGILPRGQAAYFDTLSGRLSAAQDNDGMIWLDFPAEDGERRAAPEGLAEALGVVPTAILGNRMDYLLEVDSEEAVRSLSPDLARLKAIDCRGVIVTSRGKGDFDFVSRFFAPAVGIDEDPVTGSAHCFLAPYWARRLGKSEMTGYQASKRGGAVKVALRGDRVRLGGRAITVLCGDLF